jgi:hypothetical protein
MQLVRFFIIATIIAFVPVLAVPVSVDSQELVVRESSVSRFFNRIGARIRGAFSSLGRRIRSIGRRRRQRKQKTEPTQTPVETRELGVVFAREDADDLYVRWLDDDEIYTREFDDEFEAREFDDDEFEAREFDDELDAREPASHHQHPRELSYDILD